MLATVGRGCPRAVRLVLHDGARALGVRAGVVRCHWARRVHQDMAHVRHVRSVGVRGRVVAGRLREGFQSLDQLRFRARHRQVPSLQFHLEIAHCKRDMQKLFFTSCGESFARIPE